MLSLANCVTFSLSLSPLTSSPVSSSAQVYCSTSQYLITCPLFTPPWFFLLLPRSLCIFPVSLLAGFSILKVLVSSFFLIIFIKLCPYGDWALLLYIHLPHCFSSCQIFLATTETNWRLHVFSPNMLSWVCLVVILHLTF